MKKVALALVVLAITVPAMATVTITSRFAASSGADANKVIVGYSTSGGDEVRAFALNVKVSDKAFVVGSGKQVGDPNHIAYWVYPGTMTFTLVGPNTVVQSYGNPLVEQDANGAVIEMASLYAASDPCHPSAPPSSGDLCYFYFNKALTGGDGKILIDVNTANTKRGGVVLKDPNATASVTWPPQLVYHPCTYPACWDWLAQCHGDADNDGKVKTSDFGLLKASWNKSYPNVLYNPCADFNRDQKVGTADFGILKSYWNKTPPKDCVPGDINHKYCP